MKQKIVSLLTAAVMLVPVTVIMPITANAENTPIELGEFVQMGTYDINEDSMAEPMKWRCVAFEKVTGTDENGNPIIDSTQTSMKYREGYLQIIQSVKKYLTQAEIIQTVHTAGLKADLRAVPITGLTVI